MPLTLARDCRLRFSKVFSEAFRASPIGGSLVSVHDVVARRPAARSRVLSEGATETSHTM
jgi:hypothetical protein